MPQVRTARLRHGAHANTQRHRKPSEPSSLEHPQVATQSQSSTIAHAASGRPRPAPPAALGQGASSRNSMAKVGSMAKVAARRASEASKRRVLRDNSKIKVEDNTAGGTIPKIRQDNCSASRGMKRVTGTAAKAARLQWLTSSFRWLTSSFRVVNWQFQK